MKLFADAGFPGIKQDSVAWCTAAVEAVLQRTVSSHLAHAARSYESWGVGLRESVLSCIATKKRAN